MNFAENKENQSNMKRYGKMLLLFLCLFLLNGCQSKQEESVYQIPEQQKLVVYTSHKEEVYGPIVKEFEERTGIFVEVKQGATLGLFQEIKQNAGEEACDVMFGGGIENYVSYQDYLEAYKVSEEEMIDPKYRTANHKWTAFSVLPIVFIYNNKLVYPAAAPRTWEELQTSRWKDKVAFADPARSGSSYTALCTMIQASEKDTQTVLKDFAAVMNGHVSANSGAVLDEVNSGNRLVGITLEETALKRIRQGEAISIIYPTEGTSAVPDAAALVRGAPHRENAQKFIEFTVSRDVQQILTDEFCRKPVRMDIIGSDEDSLQDEKLLPYDIVWASEKEEEILSAWEALQKK